MLGGTCMITDFDKLKSIYMELMPDSLYMSHYILAETTGISTEDWREFLCMPEIIDYNNREIAILRDVQVKKLLKDADNNKGQVGMAQMLNALGKVNDTVSKKEGPVFVYGYINPTEKEEKADNIVMINDDPFDI